MFYSHLWSKLLPNNCWHVWYQIFLMMQRQNQRCFLGAMICCVDVLKMFSSCENISQDVLQSYGCFDCVVQFAIPPWLLLRYTALCVMQFSPRNIVYSNLRYNNTTSKHFLLWICNLHNFVPVKDGHDRTYHEQAVSTPRPPTSCLKSENLPHQLVAGYARSIKFWHSWHSW